MVTNIENNPTKGSNIEETVTWSSSRTVLDSDFIPFDNGCVSFILSNHFSKMFGRLLEDFPFQYYSKREVGSRIRITFTIPCEGEDMSVSESFDLKTNDEFSISKILQDKLIKEEIPKVIRHP